MPNAFRAFRHKFAALLVAATAGFSAAALQYPAYADETVDPWLRDDRALVIDAYEYNPLDWKKIASNKRLTGFIGKGSDGLPPAYKCSGDETAYQLCKALWKRYSVAKELYHTRRAMAKSLGLKWGVYHLGRPGNPVEQADHLIDFAQPEADDLVAIDIENNDPEKWLSLSDAEIFAERIRERLGRYPVLYTNGSTAKFIADNHETYPLLSRLPLWYARYKSKVDQHFPKGHWDSYALWQFVSNINCRKDDCPYRLEGTPLDIDINVASMSPHDLRRVWPFGGLVKPLDENAHMAVASLGKKTEPAVTIPMPISRKAALEGRTDLKLAMLLEHDIAKSAATYSMYQVASSAASMKARFYPSGSAEDLADGNATQGVISAYSAPLKHSSVFSLVDKGSEKSAANGGLQSRLRDYGRKVLGRYREMTGR